MAEFFKELRGKYEPHSKLVNRVDRLEKDVPIALAQLHKTLSKSFGMQRKALLRVGALEKQVSGITIIVENIQEGLEDTVNDIINKGKKKKPRRKKPPKKSAKKPTPKDWGEGVPGDWDGTSGEPEKAIIGEPDLDVDPSVDLQPVEDLPNDIGDTIDSSGTTDEDGIDDTIDSSGTSEEQEEYNKLVSRDLKSIHSTISKLTSHTSSNLRKLIGLEQRVSSSERKISLITDILKAERSDLGDNIASLSANKSPLSESLQSISDSLTSIHQTLEDQQDLAEEQSEETSIDEEQDKRDDKEKGREKGAGIGEGLKKTGEKMLKPVKGAFDRIKDWLIKLFLAKGVMMFMKWFSDPANAKKVSSIFRFIKDWWPAIVTAILVFFGSMIGPAGWFIGVTALVVGFVPKIINAVKSILTLGLAGGKDVQKIEKEASKDDRTIGEGAKLDTEKFLDKPTPREDTSGVPEPGTQQTPGVQEFNKGGEVPGTGNQDTVPAMLTPGEFVMTKGAVEQYGVKTLEGMNAAAGGTNKPEESGGFPFKAKGGGFVTPQQSKVPSYSGGGEVKPPEEKTEDKKKQAPELNKETGNLAKRIEPLVTGQPPGMGGIGGAIMSVAEKHPAVMLAKGIGNLIGKGMGKVGDMMKKKEPDLDLKEAIADLQNRFNYSIYDGNYKPGGVVSKSKDDGGGGESSGGNPLAGFISAVSKLPIVGGPMAKISGLLVDGVEDMIQSKHDSLHLAGKQNGTATPDAPTSTVAYQEAAKLAASSGGGSAAGNSASPGGKIPSFSASSKVDSRKVKVLGISR